MGIVRPPTQVPVDAQDQRRWGVIRLPGLATSGIAPQSRSASAARWSWSCGSGVAGVMPVIWYLTAMRWSREASTS